MRFQNVQIPRGAIVHDAYLQFEADEATSETTNLVIYGQDADNPGTFTATAFDITNRKKTSASISWSAISSWAVNDVVQTINISPIIKEIVDRSNWASGNSMVMVINGSGKRIAEAWDEESRNAPGLVVNWTENADPNITSVVLNSSLGTNLTSENLTVYAINVSDPENDSVKVVYNWKKDGNSIAVLNMPMDGGALGSGGTVKDYSDFGNNGTVSGATYNSTGGYDGKGAYEFTRSPSTYLTFDNRSVSSSSFSAFAWVSPTSDFYGGIISHDTGSGANREWFLAHNTNHRLRVRMYNDSGVSFENDSVNDSVPLNNWSYVGIVVDDNAKMMYGYVNGEIVTSIAFTGSLRTTTNATTRIGITYSDVYDFNGTIDEVMIWEKALNSEQISALYNNRTDLIVSQETNLNDVWSVSATPNDGTSDGASVLSNNLTILSEVNPPQITQVQPVSAITLSQFSTKSFNVLFNVTDADGFADLNDSKAWCALSKTGEATRNSTVCTAQDQSGNDLVYNCTLDMLFYDSAGLWNISCYAEDSSGNTAINDTETTTVNDLNFVAQDSTSLNWTSLIPGNEDEESLTPLILTNGGNQDYTNFTITSRNATFGSYNIPHSQFLVDNETNKTFGQIPLNDSGVNWNEGSLLTCVEPCSSNSTEFAYFYVDTPTGIFAGVYTGISNWTISLS